MNRDSRTESNYGVLATVPYPVSADEDNRWGQPSIIHLFQITPTTRLVSGIYAVTDPIPLDIQLALEFQSWEAASDQDYANFEELLTDAAG
jgi:hypothetical protein